MFIRLKTSGTNDANFNVNHIRSFSPNAPGAEGSTLTFQDGSSVVVLDSTRSIRSYIKKAQATGNSTGNGETEA